MCLDGKAHFVFIMPKAYSSSSSSSVKASRGFSRFRPHDISTPCINRKSGKRLFGREWKRASSREPFPSPSRVNYRDRGWRGKLAIMNWGKEENWSMSRLHLASWPYCAHLGQECRLWCARLAGWLNRMNVRGHLDGSRQHSPNSSRGPTPEAAWRKLAGDFVVRTDKKGMKEKYWIITTLGLTGGCFSFSNCSRSMPSHLWWKVWGGGWVSCVQMNNQ